MENFNFEPVSNLTDASNSLAAPPTTMASPPNDPSLLYQLITTIQREGKETEQRIRETQKELDLVRERTRKERETMAQETEVLRALREEMMTLEDNSEGDGAGCLSEAEQETKVRYQTQKQIIASLAAACAALEVELHTLPPAPDAAATAPDESEKQYITNTETAALPIDEEKTDKGSEEREEAKPYCDAETFVQYITALNIKLQWVSKEMESQRRLAQARDRAGARLRARDDVTAFNQRWESDYAEATTAEGDSKRLRDEAGVGMGAAAVATDTSLDATEAGEDEAETTKAPKERKKKTVSFAVVGELERVVPVSAVNMNREGRRLHNSNGLAAAAAAPHPLLNEEVHLPSPQTAPEPAGSVGGGGGGCNYNAMVQTILQNKKSTLSNASRYTTTINRTTDSINSGHATAAAATTPAQRHNPFHFSVQTTPVNVTRLNTTSTTITTNATPSHNVVYVNQAVVPTGDTRVHGHSRRTVWRMPPPPPQ